MNLFKGFLIAMGVVVFIYTAVEIMNEGPNLFGSTWPLFLEWKWPVRFFMDFLT